MEEESPLTGGTEGVCKPPSTAPAYFVILQPSQGDGLKEEGILVANKDVSSVAPAIQTGPNSSKSDFFLSANCISGDITVTLDNNNMWNEFYRCNTEMVLTKQGRRMFPYCRYWLSGLDPCLKYILVMDITPLDNLRYKWNGKWWEPAGKSDPHVLGRVFIHPESPSTGQYWMHQPVSFYKLKLTNNILDQEGHIILHSMHRYLPRLHVIPAEKASEVIQLNGPDVHTFTFPQTEFIAVTAYQNFQITQLKIDCNPFAKGFREGTAPGRPGKDTKHKTSEHEMDSSESKNVEESEDPDRKKKLQELLRMSEYLDADKENETFRTVQDFLKFTKTMTELNKRSKQNEEVTNRVEENPSVTSLPEPTEQPIVKVKEEPEDNYDYSKPIEGVTIKQEQFDAGITNDYSNSDNDYPILEKHFAKFKEDPYLDGIHSSESPTGIKIENFSEPDQGSMHPEPAPDANNLMSPDLIKSEDTLQDINVHNLCTPSTIPRVGDQVPVKERRKRICKSKIDEIYVTLQTAIRTSRGPKRKFPKPSVTPTPGNEGTVAPIAKKRGRPPKPKFSKEALDIHTGKKPTDTVSSSLSISDATTELTDEMQKILGSERQLLTHLKTMKYRQVIHPALQQVGLKLNIVDPTMSIDLRYLGVELPLPFITSDIKTEDNGLCGQVSGFPFVSRTGKTTDYTKIKGWRDKFSTESATASIKIEGGRSESTVKNLSAFCSDELDEYLENEAKLMGDLKELTENEPVPSLSYQFPTKSSSYVRTLDSVLKKQAQQAMSSIIAVEPRKKRKYTRRALIPKADSKAKLVSTSPVTLKEKTTKSHSAEKKDHSALHLMNRVISPPSGSVEGFSKSQSKVKPAEGEHSGSVQHNSITSLEDNLFRNFQQIQTQNQQITSKPIGFSKAQMKIAELEDIAIWEGKPRTYITKERAEAALATLLTAQASLKNKPIQKMINKRTSSCNNEFCRLGCICSSLRATKCMAVHCRHETCMFSRDCLKSKSSIHKDGCKVKASGTTPDDVESDFSPSLGYNYQHREVSVDCSQVEPIKAKKRKSNEGNDSKSDLRTLIRYPIWDRSDMANDPEPLCIPEHTEFVETKTLYKVHAEKGKSPGGGKAGRPNTGMQPHHLDPVYLYFDSMMTCARVRPFQPKSQEEKRVYVPIKEFNFKLNKAIKQEKEASDEDEVLAKRCKTGDNGSSKLIEILSDGGSEDSKTINITSPGREPQSFKLGSFDIELMQENKNEEKSSPCSRVKIAMSTEKMANPTPPKPRPVKPQSESVKPPVGEPEDISSNKEAKSHGGKGLPFYSKVTPAGKLVARLKTADTKEAELIEVNGKKYPKAKLLLGQMGALHPANRLAAYITHRLQPSLFNLSKGNEVSVKMAIKSSSSDSIAEEKSKSIPTSEQNKTAAQSRPSGLLTQSVMGEVGSMQKSPGVGSAEPSILGSPKASTQPPRLLLVSSAVSAGIQAPAITTTTSMNTTSLSTTSLSSADLSTVSPSKKKASPSLPTLMRVTKVITKGSSLSIPAGIVAAPTILTSVPSSKGTVLTPPKLSPAVVKCTAAPGNASATPLTNSPGANKRVTPSLPSLLVAPNVQRIGSAASQVGLKIASPMTVKSVTASTVSALTSSRVTTGAEKRLGPRLLLIPVNNTSTPTPARPVQCVQRSPGQKMVLQPIKSASGVTLFRHPNGQLIQLVPLQQVNSGGVQSRKQQVVIRNPGSVVGIRLPLPTKQETAAPTSVSTAATPVTPAALPKLTAISPSKTVSITPGVTVLQQSPPILSPLDAPAMKANPPTSNSEAAISLPHVITCSGGGPAVIASNVPPLQSGGLFIANVPPPTLHNAATTPKSITLASSKPETLKDSNKEDKKSPNSSLTTPTSASSEDKEPVKECNGPPMSEIIKDEKKAETLGSTPQVVSETLGSTPQVVSETLGSTPQVVSETLGSTPQVVSETLGSTPQVVSETLGSTPQVVSETLGSTPQVVSETLGSTPQVVSETQEAKEEQQRRGLHDKEQGELSSDFSDVDLVEDEADKDDRQQNPGDITKRQVKNGGSSPKTSLPTCVQEQVAAGVDHKILRKTEEKPKEQRSAKSRVSESSSDHIYSEDPCMQRDMLDNMDIQHNLQTEDESELDDSVDVETVEELDEKLCIALLKASATNIKPKKDKKRKLSKARQMGSEKVIGEDISSSVEDEECNFHHRKNHTANERKRRSELRDLFEELKNALGLHNLPKVSKSYILKQAIEEIEGLTDTADSLIKKKTLLSQTQTQLVKKVSNLSGKPKEVVQKKIEYLYAKQKAMEAEIKKENQEVDEVLQVESGHLPLQKKEPFHTITLGGETNEALSSPNKKPIILARKALLLSKEGMHQQSSVSLTTSNVPMAHTEQVGKQENRVERQVASIPSALIQAELSPAQMKSGMPSLVIQLPHTISLKDFISNSPVPISWSTVPGNISTAPPSVPEKDDLSMMPKIVNVTSLAQEAKSDLGKDLGIGIPDTKRESIPSEHPLNTDSIVRGNVLAQDTSSVTMESCLPSTSVPVTQTKEILTTPVRKRCSPYSGLIESSPQENYSSHSGSKNVSKSDVSPSKMVDEIRNSRLDLELKKLTTAIDEAGLDPSELSDATGDPEEADETLTSLLNEIAFLNQQLNNDTEDLDFPGSDTASRSSVSKFVDGDSSPFSFSRFKEVSETKEKNLSFSPLFMQLEEGEIPDTVKHNEEASIMVLDGGAKKDPAVTVPINVVRAQRELQPPPPKTDTQGSSCSDVFWRPMPKLAPLGLKSQAVASDQRVLASKPMPSLASVAMILSSPKTKD
ncbi:MAX gene-associated protein isoform X2 [Engystomops pustulosus]|uniref:MAX gene-associated protein isoform X2 n=1 Tax=Engystomops pustulosus TaxID=76066 RepID=UPI003AFA771C